MNTLGYVYAILDAGPEGTGRVAWAGLAGIAGAAVRPLTLGSLAAAVSDMPAEEFEEEALNLGDVAWLGPRAVAHQQINASLFAAARALLPLQFGAVFRDDAGVVRLLSEQGATFRARLEHLRGRSEWVVMLRRDDTRALAALERSSAALADLRRQIAEGSPGRAYLLQRRLDEVRRHERFARDHEATQALAAALGPHAVDSYREPLPEQVADGILVRLSLLVARDREQALLAAVERLNADWGEHGYACAATGPWPAYRFGGLPLEETHVAS